jgi:Putative auto-transporter adhesin, head GIN domain
MSMKKIIYYLLLAGFANTAVAQKTVVNDKNAEVRTVSTFTGVHIASGIDLYITQGDVEGVAVSANDVKYRENIKTRVENGILKIYYDAGEGVHINWGWADRKMKAYVTVKNIDVLHASGGSDIYTEGALQATKLDLHLSGGSDFKGNLDVGTLTVRQSGGSDVNVSGKVATLTIGASGGSDFKGYELITDNCEVDASGGSDVYVTVNKELNVRASGGSDVSYKGAGVIKNLSTSGSSDVKKRG